MPRLLHNYSFYNCLMLFCLPLMCDHTHVILGTCYIEHQVFPGMAAHSHTERWRGREGNTFFLTASCAWMWTCKSGLIHESAEQTVRVDKTVCKQCANKKDILESMGKVPTSLEPAPWRDTICSIGLCTFPVLFMATLMHVWCNPLHWPCNHMLTKWRFNYEWILL